MFKLHKWPFTDEVVKLLWIKSPYKNNNKDWILPLLFLDEKNNVAKVEVNWATLPFLRFGQYYLNSFPTDIFQEGTIITLDIEEVSRGSVCESSSLPDELFPFKEHITGEKIWQFETQGKVVFIPCVELIRAFFANNSTFARALLEENGLEFLISYYESSDEFIKLKIDYSVPRKLITEDFVKHLVWIKSDSFANKIWHSILNNIWPRGDIEPPLLLFPEAIPESELGRSKKIEMVPPIIGKSKWEVRSLIKENNLFILELMGVDNLVPPYLKIYYSHQTFIRKKAEDSNQSKRKTRVRKNDSANKNVPKAIVSESPTKISNLSILKIRPTMIRFSQETKLEKIHKQVGAPSSKKQKQNHGPISKRERREKEIREHQEKLRRTYEENNEIKKYEALISSATSTFLGNSEVSPIEVIGSKISNNPYEDGLEQFCEMVYILRQKDNRLKIYPPKISSIPGDRSFSLKEDGTPRRYALVELQYKKKSYYLLEIERISKIYLATLIIQARSGTCFGNQKLNLIIYNLLKTLIDNKGNWKIRSLTNHEEAKIFRVKHLEEWTSYDWAEVILERLNLPL